MKTIVPEKRLQHLRTVAGTQISTPAEDMLYVFSHPLKIESPIHMFDTFK